MIIYLIGCFFAFIMYCINLNVTDNKIAINPFIILLSWIYVLLSMIFYLILYPLYIRYLKRHNLLK
jgi:hypothetical protein